MDLTEGQEKSALDEAEELMDGQDVVEKLFWRLLATLLAYTMTNDSIEGGVSHPFWWIIAPQW